MLLPLFRCAGKRQNDPLNSVIYELALNSQKKSAIFPADIAVSIDIVIMNHDGGHSGIWKVVTSYLFGDK